MHLDRARICPGLNVGVAPGGGAGRDVPARTGVGGHLDTGDHTSDIRGCAGDGDSRAVGDRCTGDRGGDGCGRGRVVAARGRRHEGRVQRRRLRAHVGKEVDLCLLHSRVGGGASTVMLLVESPGPLDRSSREDKRAAGSAIQRHMVSGGARQNVGAVVLQVLLGRPRCGGQADESDGTEAVVDILIRLIADGVAGERLGRSGGKGRERGVAPQPRLALGRAHRHREVAEVSHVFGAGETVLRQSGSVGLRGEPGVAPGAGPHRRAGVELLLGPRFLVRDESAVGHARATRRRVLVARVPVGLVAGEELHVDAGIARGLDIRPLAGRPVLVVAHGEEHAVIGEVGPEPVGVHAAEVTDVVTVLLEEPHHRVFVGEVEVATRILGAGGDRAVVADLVGTTVRRALVEVGAAVGVVGLPRGIGGLEKHCRVAREIANDESDLALAAGVGSFE